MLPTDDPLSTAALGAAVLLLLSWLGLRMKSREGQGRRSDTTHAPEDSTVRWQPQAARVMTASEGEAYRLLVRALPGGFVVLAQVPLLRFLRVPARVPAAQWVNKVGPLSADLLVCDSSSRVLAVIDVRTNSESDRSKRRHERMVRLLRAAGIGVYAWREDMLPSVEQVRALLGAQLARSADGEATREFGGGTASRPMPLIPVPEISEVLADGDALAAQGETMEPVPSAFFEEIDLRPAGGHR
jgi:hypothetical protein